MRFVPELTSNGEDQPEHIYGAQEEGIRDRDCPENMPIGVLRRTARRPENRLIHGRVFRFVVKSDAKIHCMRIRSPQSGKQKLRTNLYFCQESSCLEAF